MLEEEGKKVSQRLGNKGNRKKSKLSETHQEQRSEQKSGVKGIAGG